MTGRRRQRDRRAAWERVRHSHGGRSSETLGTLDTRHHRPLRIYNGVDNDDTGRRCTQMKVRVTESGAVPRATSKTRNLAGVNVARLYTQIPAPAEMRRAIRRIFSARARHSDGNHALTMTRGRLCDLPHLVGSKEGHRHTRGVQCSSSNRTRPVLGQRMLSDWTSSHARVGGNAFWCAHPSSMSTWESLHRRERNYIATCMAIPPRWSCHSAAMARRNNRDGSLGDDSRRSR
jgi:hypothetical protein